MSDIVISMSDIVLCKMRKNEEKRPDFLGSFHNLLKFFTFSRLSPLFLLHEGGFCPLYGFLPYFGVKSPYFGDFLREISNTSRR